MISPDIAELAERSGIAPAYRDVNGNTVHCSEAAITGVLAAMGPCEPSPPDAVVVAWDGELPALADGLHVCDPDGHRFAPGPLPLGYHRLCHGDAQVGTVVSAPRHAPATATGRWGVFLPLYALRAAGGTPQGIATYGDLGGLFDWLHTFGGEVLLTLPLLPLYLDPPADWSPYSPVSRRLWNELYIDLDAAAAAFGVTLPADSPPTVPAPQPVDGLLDYPALHAHHTARLDALAAALHQHPQLQQWLAAHPLAALHARYRGAQALHGRNFRAWPVSREQALAAADPTVVRRHLVGQWLADVQLGEVAAAARRQGQLLALDVALGAHADGFDVWHEGNLFVQDVAVGAPPDPVFMGGQNWGFPPIHPQRSRLTGHRYVRETFRHHLRHAGLLRIDHVMGLFRQWWVPAGLPATDGCYVHYPLDEMFAIVCLEAHLAGAVIVGENLGTVPHEVHQGLAEHHLLGIHVAQDALPSYGTDGMWHAGSGVMAMLSTHDSVPFASFWHGGDIDRAHRLGLVNDGERDRLLGERAHMRERVVRHLAAVGLLQLDAEGNATTEEIMAAVVLEMASMRSEITVFALDDLWLEARSQNVPGTFQEEPNWRHVAALTLDEVAADPRIAGIATAIERRRAAVAGRPARV
ncbi:MAG: 4-alpha-glucanotransferase [Actinomycetota bacterium]|nr:4-alpha-glucanotransferase [Actinomycetota bacterium]